MGSELNPHDREEDALQSLLEKAALRRTSRRDLPPPTERVRLRTTVGLTQKQVAEYLSVPLPTLKAWEAGKWEPRPGERRERYAEFLTRLAEEVARIEQQQTGKGRSGGDRHA
jgi:DNA-binding transcriptional regulator YiaG